MAMNNLTNHPRPPINAVWVAQDMGPADANLVMKQRFTKLSLFIEKWDYFETPEQLYEYLDANLKTKTFLIMSGRTAQTIVPARHTYENIHSMYVFCCNVNEHRRLKGEYEKVKDVMNLESDVYERIADELSQLLIEIGESYVQSNDRGLARNNLEEALRLMRDVLGFRPDHGRIRKTNDLLERLDTWNEL